MGSSEIRIARRTFVRKLLMSGLIVPCLEPWSSGAIISELQSQKIPPSFFGPRSDTVVTWLGMAGVLVNCRGTALLIDPLITLVESEGEMLCEGHYRLRTPLPIESRQMPHIDVVLFTHADGDHFSRVTAEVFAARETTKFVAPPPVERGLLNLGVSKERIVTARDFDSIEFGAAVVEVTPALHDWQDENPWRRGDCCGYVVRTPDGSIWHPGDTRLIDELLEVKDVDVLFFDVAAVRSHLGPEGSAKLAVSSGAKVTIAYHYGTFVLPKGSYGNCDPKDALPYTQGLSARFLLLNPGEILHLPLPS